MELADLKQKNFYKPNIMTDMPRGGESEEQNLKYVSDVMLIEDLINYSLRKLQYKRKTVEEFLNTVEDAELRSIMRLRAVNNMSWYQIGEELGKDRRTVSKKFYDYFENWLNQMVNDHFVNIDDMKWVHVVNNLDEVMTMIDSM